MAVLFSLTPPALLLVLVTLVHAYIMVETMDGSFVPLSLAARAPGDGIGVRLTNNNDYSYLATVSMGTPPQQIQMATSLSQNFISVASPPAGVTDSTFYNPSISTSSSALSGTASTQTIAGGTVQGHFAGETCVLKSATSALSFTYNASVLVTDPAVTTDLYPLDARAILGYGLLAPATPANASLLNTFLPKNFTHAVCGIELNHMNDPFPDGIFTMGAVDPTVFTGDFSNVAVPATSPTSWSVPFDNLTYLSNGISNTMPGMLASVDMYHTGIQITTDAATQLYAGVQGSQRISTNLWSIPCASKFPLALTFAGTPFTMSERDTIIKQADGTCTGVVTGGAQGIGKVGAPFMRTVYTQFFADKASDGSLTAGVGFATKNVRQTSNPPPTNSKSQFTVRPTATGAQSPPAVGTSGSTSSSSRLLIQDGGFSSMVAMISVAATLLIFWQ